MREHEARGKKKTTNNNNTNKNYNERSINQPQKKKTRGECVAKGKKEKKETPNRANSN